MIEDKAFMEKQAKRFAGLPGWPEEREARAEIAYAFRAFDTQQAAESWASEWVARETSCPKPADIRRAAYDARERDNTAWLEAKKCPHCSGSGFRLVIRRKRSKPGMPERDYEYAQRCDHTDRGCDHTRNSWCGRDQTTTSSGTKK